MSKMLSNIPEHKRELVRVIRDGSSKTFVYRIVDEEDRPSAKGLWSWIVQRNRKLKNKKRDT